MNKKEKALSLSDKVLQSSFLDRFEEFLDKKESRPWVIELDPTTACNLACHGCISASLLNQGGFKRERIKYSENFRRKNQQRDRRNSG